MGNRESWSILCSSLSNNPLHKAVSLCYSPLRTLAPVLERQRPSLDGNCFSPESGFCTLLVTAAGFLWGYSSQSYGDQLPPLPSPPPSFFPSSWRQSPPSLLKDVWQFIFSPQWGTGPASLPHGRSGLCLAPTASFSCVELQPYHSFLFPQTLCRSSSQNFKMTKHTEERLLFTGASLTTGTDRQTGYRQSLLQKPSAVTDSI